MTDAISVQVHRDVIAALSKWAPSQRWFRAKDTAFEITEQRWRVVTEPLEDALVVEVILLTQLTGGEQQALNVPVVLRRLPVAGVKEIAQVGSGPDSWLLYDALISPEYWNYWLQNCEHTEFADRTTAPDFSDAKVITGEQSNSSVVFPHLYGGGILKILRVLEPGDNPDFSVPLEIARTNWAGVPKPYAFALLQGPLFQDSTEVVFTSVLSEFIFDAADGFELACQWAGQERDFSEIAQRLGSAIAELHLRLHNTLSSQNTEQDLAWLQTQLRQRLEQNATQSKQLTTLRPELDSFIISAIEGLSSCGLSGIPIQRIHGDLHLGQVLYREDRGWIVLDFEGEPMRPLAQRLAPDLVQRDIAGILRSFDYAAAIGKATDPQWQIDARNAFLQAYLEVNPEPINRLVDLLEIDKAGYEVVYEELNRPDWITVPLNAIKKTLTS